jgi:hypothetical protein
MNIALIVISYAILMPVQLAYIGYLVYRLMRMLKLSDCRAVLPAVLKARLGLIGSQAALAVLEVVLSQVDGDYWLSSTNFLAFLELFPIILSGLQIAAYYFEYRKRVPYSFLNGVLWVVYCAFNALMLVALGVQDNPYVENYAVLMLKLAVSAVLLVICVFKFQDYTEFFHLRLVDTIKLSHLLISKNAADISRQTDRMREQFELSQIGAEKKQV